MSIRKGSKTIASSVPTTEWGDIEGSLENQVDLNEILNSKASTYSPIFTGIPLAPTPTVGVNNNQIATTKYVQDALLNAGGDLPEQTGHSGQFLTTNGTLPSWVSISQVPSQSGQSGKFLTTNGTTASWSTLNGVVHLTGDETIEGNKTIRNGNICLDINSTIKKNVTYTGTWARDVFELSGVDTTKFFKFGAAGLESSGNITYGFMGLNGYDSNDNIRVYNTYATAPTPTATNSTSEAKIATTGWVNDPTKSTNVVHRTDDETITGQKTFHVTNSDTAFIIKSKSLDLTNASAADGDVEINWKDKNGNTYSVDYLRSNTSGSIYRGIACKAHNSNTWSSLIVGYDSSDNAYTLAPTPPANSNDNNIATTSWVNTKLSGSALNSGTNISIDSNNNINYTGPRYYRLATRTWTYAQWTQYCERGVTTNISPSYIVTGIRAGDLVTVEGICSDRGNTNVLAWGIAQGEAAAETNNVSVTFLGLNIQDTSDVVHRSGDETITGVKTFSGDTILIKNKSTEIDTTTSPSQQKYIYTDYIDKNNVRMGVVGGFQQADGKYGTYLQAGNEGMIKVISDGTNVTTSAPTPASATDNSTKIATTQWFRNALTSLLPTVRMTKYGDIGTTLPYTAPIDGIMRVKIGAVYNWELYINGILVQQQSRNDSDSCVTTWICIPVKQGDVLTAASGHFDGGAMYYPY